jgi:uncharacterized membrane protein (UPF0127 family)
MAEDLKTAMPANAAQCRVPARYGLVRVVVRLKKAKKQIFPGKSGPTLPPLLGFKGWRMAGFALGLIDSFQYFVGTQNECFSNLAGCTSGCNKPAPAAPTPPSAKAVPSAPWPPTKAQARLTTTNLWIGPHVTVAELALTRIQAETGMMFRTNMPENEGMLFVFPMAHQASFWMMNCPLPLSAAYINPDGMIEEIHDLRPFDTNLVVANSSNIQYVLETPQGWFQRHNVSTGVVIRTEYGPLRGTFLRRQ